MRILVTGANGFIGKNIICRLNEIEKFEVIPFSRRDSFSKIEQEIVNVGAIIHLAGENRPADTNAFHEVNVAFTQKLCDLIAKTESKASIIFSSSTQAELDNAYGKSKLNAEKIFKNLAQENGNKVYIYRLPGVFGKWAKPNYNSVIATFCYNTAHDLPLEIHNRSKTLNLVYIDDVMEEFISALEGASNSYPSHCKVEPVYEASLSEIACALDSFKSSRSNLNVGCVGTGFFRALYATYLSYIPNAEFAYPIRTHDDQRGRFVEFLKTPDCGQFSYFTAKPGVTRGGHYHHTKNEKFLVVEGKAKFSFRNLIDNQIVHIVTDSNTPRIVETAPGWSHEVTNIGDKDLIVLLWANEVFNPQQPDTVRSIVTHD